MGKGDNMPQFIVLLSADTINRAEEIGNEWGAQEAELWREAHEGKPVSDMPEWTNGTWCGSYPNETEAVEEYRIAYRAAVEARIDAAAEAAWRTAAKELEE